MSFIGNAIGSITGANQAAKAADKASQAQVQSAAEANAMQLQASREAIDFQRQMADQARSDQEPWRLAGANALSQLASRTGAGGDLMQNSTAFSQPFSFQGDPGYAFREAEGMRGINNSAAARGGILSGAALKAASRYNQNFASNEYGNAYGRYQTDQTNKFNRDNTNQTNQFNRLASIAGVGQTAASQAGQNALSLGNSVGDNLTATAANMGQNITGAGNARASGYLAAGQQQGNTFNSLLGVGIGAAGLGWKPFK